MIACDENQPMSDLTPHNDAPPATTTVWEVYKSRFIYTQLFIVVACVGVFLFRRNFVLALTLFFFLQLTAVYGSWMGKRLVDQINAATPPDQNKYKPQM
jgi:hypothetical protein